MKQFFRTIALILCFTVTLSGIPVYADENITAGESIEQPDGNHLTTDNGNNQNEGTGQTAGTDEESPDVVIDPGTEEETEIAEDTTGEPDEDLSAGEEAGSTGELSEDAQTDTEEGMVTVDTESAPIQISGEDMPLDTADVVGEIEELRNESSKSFLLSDGSFSVATYDTDVHYQSEDGEWEEIDNSLTADQSSGDGNGFSNQEGRVRFKFAKNSNQNYLVRMKQGPTHLYISLPDRQKNKDVSVISETESESAAENTDSDDPAGSQMSVPDIYSSVTYEDILPATDIQYITGGSSLKENIIVKAPGEAYQYDFEIKTNKLDVREEDGVLSFVNTDDGSVLYTIPQMYMTDADGNQSDAVSWEITEQKNKKLNLRITADAEWINEPERKFPVTIDPSLEATSSSTGDEQRIVRNQYVCSGHTGTSYAGNGAGFLGYDSSGDYKYRTFVQFKKLPKLPADSVINQAKFFYGQMSYDHVDMPNLTIAAKEVTTDWNWGTSITWNSQPGFTNTVLDYQTLSTGTRGKYIGWDITKLIKRHYEDKDNTTNTTSSFALVTYDESELTNVHCAKAQIIQENSAGYFSSAEPVLAIAYRSTRGLEGYYTYADQSAGRAGDGSVGDYTSQLTFEKEILSNKGSVMDFTLSQIYNSACSEDNFTFKDGNILTKTFNKMKTCCGWKLNIQETIIEKTIGGTLYYIYNDSDGTEHYFKKNSSTGKFEDEDGLKLTIEKSDSAMYTMVDEKGNKKFFKYGFLTQIKDANENKINLIYNGKTYDSSSTAWYPANSNNNQVTGIVQVNTASPSSVIRIATLSYDSNGYVTQIQDGNNRKTTYTYSGKNLVKITHPDGTCAQYTYDNHYLTKAYDAESKTGVKYGYKKDKNGWKVSSISEYAVNDSGSEVSGAVIDVDGSNLTSTLYRDRGADGKSGTSDDIVTEVVFDYAGRTVNESSTDTTRKKLYGAATTSFTGTGNTNTSNKVSSDIVVGTHGVNLLPYGGFEGGDTGWTYEKYASVPSAISVYISSTNEAEGIRSGQKSAKINFGSAQADSNGDLKCVLKKDVTLTSGTTYTFSGYFKATDTAKLPSGSRVWLQILDSNGNRKATSAIIKQPTSADIENGWSRLSARINVAGTGTYSVQAVVEKAKGPVYFDDFQLENSTAPSKYNLLDNGDAEWSSGWSTNHKAEYYASAKLTGSRGLRIQGDPDELRYSAYSLNMNESSNNTFVLSGWSKGFSIPETTSDVNKRYYGLKLDIIYSDNTKEIHHVPFSDTVTTWQYTSGNIVPKQQDKTIKQIIVYCVYSKNANTAYFDNISLRKEPVETYKYDSKGNVVAVNQPDTETVNYQYSGADLISSTSAGSGKYEYKYDSRHNVTSATNDSVKASYTYNSSGAMTGTELASTKNTSGKKMTSSATYSTDSNYLKTAADNTGAVTKYTTNSYGLTSRVEDAAGNALDYEYDTGNDRNTSVSQSGKARIALEYSEGQLSRLDRCGYLPGGDTEQKQTYQFAYDAFGNQISVKAGNYVLETNEYAANNGNLKKTTYGNGDTVEYEYDIFDRITAEKYNGIVKYRYVYNSEGDLSSKVEVDASGNTVNTVYYEYDSLDRLIRSWEERTEDGKRTETQRTQHIYDKENRIKSQSWRVGSQPTRTESYEYNTADGSLKKMTTAAGETVSFTYDHLKRITGQSGTVLSAAATYRDLDSTRTTDQISEFKYTGLKDALTYSYTYDTVGNITQIKENNQILAEYTYDSQNQLIKEELPQSGLTYEYIYDTYGNIRSVKKTEEGGSAETKEYQYGDTTWLDLLTSYDGNSISYDNSGNPLNWYSGGKQWQLGWTNGELTSATGSDGTSISYGYDMDGIRDEKTVNGVRHEYVTQGGNVVLETWGDNTLEFIYAGDGKPYALIYNDVKYYYVTNLQGDVVRLVDTSGNTVASYEYNGWGEALKAESSGTSDIAEINPIRYRGLYYDYETKLYYIQSRYFSPVIGRFMNADDVDTITAEHESTVQYNLYVYCFNNPANLLDKDGAWPGWATKVLIGAAAIAVGAVAAGLTGGTAVILPAIMSSVKVAATSAAVSAGTSVIKHRIKNGSWKGSGKVALNSAADGFMWGGIAAGSTTIKLAKKGTYINKIGKLKPEKKKGYFGVRYAKRKGKNFSYKSFELHSPHKRGHKLWHIQKNQWSYHNKKWRVSSKKSSRWTLFGKKI